jgi:hydroxyacylglutathione hydrolase
VIDFERAGELARQPAHRLLDVRRKTEFEAGHLPGARNIAHTRLRARADEVEGGARQLVYCRSGARAAVAAALLARLGLTVAYVDDKIAAVAPRDLEIGEAVAGAPAPESPATISPP